MSGDSNGANGSTNHLGRTNGNTSPNGDNGLNGLNANGNQQKPPSSPSSPAPTFQPVAICGMACRLPGGIHSPSELWSFLHAGRDARGPVPSSRYNISAFHSPHKKPGTVIAQQGYFLDSTNDLAALDTSFFTMPRREVETLDPQQRLLLEVAREAIDDAGETRWKGTNVGVYVGCYGQDWYDISVRDTQAHGIYQVLGQNDFMVSNRLSHELDLHGPSVTLRSACSASLIGVNEACMSIARGDCTSAIVGGTNIIMAPALTAAKSEQGVLSPDGSCNTFSANANGYARGEGIVAIYLKPLAVAVRDGNPIRAVVTGSAANHNGHTPTVSHPSSQAQEALIRQAYRNAGITEITRTGFFECHGTGTRTGVPIEVGAVSACFGKAGVHMGSVKANLGHAEGAAGLVGVLKAVLSLENGIIPPNIKSFPRNPAIAFENANLVIPTEPIPWPEDRDKRVSINSFGLGGSNSHAIIESAASFIDSPNSTRAASNTPYLLLFSANTAASLKAMGEKYEAFLERSPDLLPDAAYTLANKREHLPYRTYAICTSDEITPPAPLPSTKAPQLRDTSLVMVFTGQGAQWPRMGYEILRSKSNPVFRNTIASLDKALQELGPLAPSWTIDEEFRKPARKSRVDVAEYSQPLCTALQIALVDTYASIGIRPAAVLGHSSGEIAAGGLSAREAIVVAFLRGLATTRQGAKGAMGALGMSWEAAKKHLVPGVVLACDNAPNSIIKNIKQSDPRVLASVLKVDKAYYSPHMAEIGTQYKVSMTDAGVVGNVHTLPFFSSVSGQYLVPIAKDRFGPEYWQTNLERPVLFTSAVRAAIKQHVGPSKQVFLEVGPHAALAGPMRQILNHSSSSAAYISSLTRGTDCAESWLSALGQLFVQHVPFNLQALMPSGKPLSDLPSYPWDHHRTHWSESRVAHEWRMRKYPYHDLLGAKVLETTDLEPVWRNLLHIENAPWIRDHRINTDIILRFAGYIAMAAEAIRQITVIEEAVEFGNITVRTTLVLNESSTKEIVTTFRRLRLTDSLDSEWWEFTISSHNGQTWVQHSSGEIRAWNEIVAMRDWAGERENLPRKASSKRWYDTMRNEGLDYGYHFESLEDITTTTTGARMARARVHNNWHGDEQFYHLHPVILDSYFQLLSIAARYGLTYDYHQVVPASVGSLILRRCSVNNLLVSATAVPTGSAVCGTGTVSASGETIIELSKVRLTSFTNGVKEEHAPITARSEWVPHFETAALGTLVKPTRIDEDHAARLDELVSYSIDASRRSTTGLDVIPELRRYKTWLDEVPCYSEELCDATLNTRIEALARSLGSTPVAHIAKAITLVTDDAPAILSGRKKAFELGAGVGSATAGIVETLTRPDGQVLFSQYAFSDPAPGMVEVLKARFQGFPNMSFHGFDERKFDLIIAAGVLHSTPKLSESLIQARQLLTLSGRLLLQSLRPGLSWSKYVLGLLPSWDNGVDDGRSTEPYVNMETWQTKLATAGFEITGELGLNSDGPRHICHVIVGRSRRDHLPARKATVLSESSTVSSESHPVIDELLSRGYEISYCSLADIPPPGQDIIAFLDGQTSQCADPHFAQIHGLARCIRSELSIAFATCEADDMESPRGCQTVASVFQSLSERVNDGEIEPDFEYIIENGVTRVHRFFPVSSTSRGEAGQVTSEARLTISQPGRLDTLHWEGATVAGEALQDDEVHVEIHAAGLNFRDVLVAMGILDVTPPTFGYEGTGIVRRVGPKAGKLSIGDRVALVGFDVFASTVTTTEKLCERLPDELDFINGASMPLVFATTIYSLINVGLLRRGQSVLIHSGCGGVGLAAIQVARMIGAEIFTTVSCGRKIGFLVQEFGISRHHIFNSRRVSFQEDLLRQTNGRGIDLALNSLSGELLHATWRCVAKWGTLVEIGKRDLLGRGKLDMELFLANRSYRCVDIDQMCKERPEMISPLLRSMMDFFRGGYIRAIPIEKVFPCSEIQESLQHMQQGSHIGKIVLQFRDPASAELQLGQIQAVKMSSTAVLDSSASYLLVGGTGGLGRSVAVWMVQHGARHLTSLSRSAGTTDRHKLFVTEIQSMGCEVHLVRGSVTNAADVARAVAESPRPLKGVCQMTMVLHDQAWQKMAIDDWNETTAPKVKGTWNLHNEMQLQNLDFFILFSSLSGIVGQHGQAGYASANTFLDAFVKFRTSKGLPCTSGYLVEQNELLNKMKGAGWRPVQESELLEVLGTAMLSATTKVTEDEPPKPSLVDPNTTLVGIAPVIPLSSPDSSARLRKDVRMSVFRNIRSQGNATSSSDGLRQFLSAAKASPEMLNTPQSVALLAQEIGKKLLGLVLRSPDDKIDVSLPLAQLGLDSMVAVEMQAWWKQMFGLDISVLEMLSMGTLKKLGKQAADGLLGLWEH
ncbi:type I polyketide synthase [Aspergillus neoniger CBS 115656]|uniref:Ketoacyl-synt-domain-containing protein n=1 Tax=Aspergillus neoniger (strain CBS 115656) TaxID=1448310 RepID=A0A318YSD7_ASPNB|nr:ketoacyl-synt-domain-containing protein [Aspergillus neoniger CBS 115656]PYH37625.1 ketoacyl-synt-domain-containing protein [Aspergillus neoniger CBS 115656]